MESTWNKAAISKETEENFQYLYHGKRIFNDIGPD